MHIVLDGSVCFETQSAPYKYFAEMLPRLSRHPELHIEWIPSPTGILSPPPSVERRERIAPSGRWIPEGTLKRWLSRRRRELENWVWKRREAEHSELVFHSFYYSTSPSPHARNVVLVLDLILELFREEFPGPVEEAMRRTKAEAIQRATRLVAISENTRQDLCRIYDIDPARVDVIPLGVNLPFYSERVDSGLSREVPGVFDHPYLLQVGGRMHHKNFSRLLEAFALGKFGPQYRLVCAGERWSDNEERLMRRLGIEGNIMLLHKPDEPRLRELYQRAEALVYPSYYEGFGMPPLEAMACGAPVAASRAASIPEVVGEAAVLFDPKDPEDMVRAISEVLTPETAARLRKAGPERAARFDWDRTAELTVSAYRRALKPA